MNHDENGGIFELLVQQFLDGTLNSKDASELERILLASAERRASFYEQVDQHALLGGWDHPVTSDSSEVITGIFPAQGPITERTTESRNRWHWLPTAGIAAALVIGLFLGRKTKSPAPAPQNVAVAEAGTGKKEPLFPGHETFDAEKRYEETMARITMAGSQTRPPAKATPAAATGEKLSYNRDIRPILSDRCFACHGPDANTREADLRLDTPKDAYAALGDGGWHQIKPGEPEKSEVFYRITTDDEDDKMPPSEAKLPRMAADEVAKIEQWIREGAEYEQHWAFTRIERPEVPHATWPNKARNEIDHFLQRKIHEAGFEPAPEADASTLLRRLYFDLTGLPPTPDRVQSVLENGLDEKRYDEIVVELLSSVHHAEHFAARWLDKARYADTTGYQYDTPRIMWRWRDWVIDAFHENKPYDKFLTEQIAGDLIPGATRDQIIATGYNRNHPITIEGGTIAEEYRVQYVSDRVNTIGSSVLGLTMECAKCHDHKYDPISQADYFRMFAFFNNIPEGGSAGGGKLGSPLGAIARPYIFAPTVEQEARQNQLREAISKEVSRVLNPTGEAHNAYLSWQEATRDSVGWKPLMNASVESSSGLPFRDLGDGSWLVESEKRAAAGEVYEFEIPMKGAGWQSLLVEALRHESLPRGGPGRFGNANAVLSRVGIIEIAPDGTENSIPLRDVKASYEQAGYPASNLLEDPGGKGWGFFHPKMEDRRLAVVTDETFGRQGDWTLKIVLTFSVQWSNHTYGRTRLSLSRIDELDDAAINPVELLSKDTEKLTLEERYDVVEAFLRAEQPERASRFAQNRAALTELKAEVPPVMVMEEMDVPRPTFVLDRGAYDAPVGDPLEPGSPTELNDFLEEYPKNRLGLAKWMTSRENPLTARVAVNHLWDRFFGIGITKTVEDFGAQGEWPSHPALLDWLASELIESGWDRQHIVRLIVDSAAYRQSSHTRPEIEKVDPDNRLVARGPRGRFSAEMIRDQALASSGLLNPEVGGPGVNPYQPSGIWEELTRRPGFAMSYEVSPGDDIYRRSIYTFWKRAAPPAMMSVFDAPSREICTVRRESTNTPLQALALLNGDTYVEAARALAQSLLRDRLDASDDELIRIAFERIVHRSPNPEELSIATQLFARERARVSDEESLALLKVGRLSLDDSLPQDRLLGLTMVNRLFYNLSETITRH